MFYTIENIKEDADSNYWFFANASSGTYRENEFYLRFARHDPSGEVESLSIHMFPYQAKVVMKQLEYLINEYEKKEPLPDVQLLTEGERKIDYRPPIHG